MNDVLNRRRAATRHGRNYSWAELMKRDWAIDVLACPRCQGRMRLLAESIHPSPYEKFSGVSVCPACAASLAALPLSSRTFQATRVDKTNQRPYKARVCARMLSFLASRVLCGHGKHLWLESLGHPA